jgi:hypothetical protein
MVTVHSVASTDAEEMVHHESNRRALGNRVECANPKPVISHRNADGEETFGVTDLLLRRPVPTAASYLQ